MFLYLGHHLLMALVFMYLMSAGILDWFCHVMMEMLFVCREWEGERNLDRQTYTERQRERERERESVVYNVGHN